MVVVSRCGSGSNWPIFSEVSILRGKRVPMTHEARAKGKESEPRRELLIYVVFSPLLSYCCLFQSLLHIRFLMTS